jgi:hypothetical protein
MQRILALLLVLAVAAPAQEVGLSYTFKKGETVRTKELTTNVISAEAMGGTQVIKNTRYTKTVVGAVTADGTADVVRSTDSSAMTRNDQPFVSPQASASEKIAYKLKIDRSGKVLEAEPVEAPTDAMGKQLTDAMTQQFKSSPGLPTKKLKVGESWNDEVTNNQPTPNGTLTTTIKLTTTLEKLEKRNGIDVALLKISGTISGELGAGMGTITGTVTGGRTFAYKQGYEVQSVMEMNQTMDIATPQGNMVMETKLKQERERIK